MAITSIDSGLLLKQNIPLDLTLPCFGGRMRISSTDGYKVDLTVVVRGQRVLDERITYQTPVRHPAQIASLAASDYRKTFMQREEVKKAAILPEEVEVRGQLVYG